MWCSSCSPGSSPRRVWPSSSALALFPLNFANFSVPFSALESYPLGPVVLDLIGMVVVTYALVSLVSTPLAALSFRRHQVA